MANSVEPDQTAHIDAVCSRSMLFVLLYLQQKSSADDKFQMHFFLGS